MDTTPAVKPRWSFETKASNSHKMIFDGVRTGWEQWALLMTDEHIDSKDCNRDLLTRHHEEAVERNAPIFKFGDLMDLMQGKWDKRADFKQMRPEHVGNNYLDLVIDTTADYYASYADNIALMTPGNHEASITQRHGTQMMTRLQEAIRNRSEKRVTPALGAYAGFVSFIFKFGSDDKGYAPTQQRVVLHYHHGYGGGGEVTRGMIDNNRTRGQYLADIYIMGHIHRRNEDENVLLHLDQNGNVVQKVQNFLRSGTYKNEGMHGNDWHVMQGRSGRPQGGWWIRFFTVRRNGVLCIDWDCIKAK